jgi:hypothetical protein
MTQEEVMRMNPGNIPQFDGDHSRFQLWWRKFQAFAYLAGFSEAIKEERDSDLPETYKTPIDTESQEGRRMMIAKKQNEAAMSCFTMAFVKEGVMGLVSRAITKEWPGGLAYLVVQGLMNKYHPNDTYTLVEMRKNLNMLKMRKGSDPALMFEQLSSIQEKYLPPGETIDERDLIAIVLAAAPMEYQSCLTDLQNRKGKELKLIDIEVLMNQHYRSLVSMKGMSNDNGRDEILLSSFGGECFHCGKEGHRANQCPDREKKGKSKS